MEMTNKEILAKQISDALNTNEEFCKALLSAEDATSAQKVLNENGIDVTIEDVEAIFNDGMDELKKFKDNADRELSDQQLDDIAGGGVVRGVLRTTGSAVAAFGMGMACGANPAFCPAAYSASTGLAAWSAAGFMKKGW